MNRAKWIFAISAALLLAVWHPWSVQAHAVPVQSTPTDGAVLTTSPKQVMVTFSNVLDPKGSQLVVYDRRGQKVDIGDCGVAALDPSRKTLVTTLESDLPPGKYNIYWTTVTDTEDVHDGHVVNGQLEFFVAEPPWLTFLKGIGITLSVAAALGGWFAFAATTRKLKRLEQQLRGVS
ncbi:MAG: copper resistance protein CopC [Anaerolineales bacterium]|nr:copper resistance protein CopC [Anaerolineales bacterium]